MDVVIAVAKYVRDLLDVDESKIKLGRDNFDNQDYNAELIVVDNLADVHDYSTLRFNSNTEEMKHFNHFNSPITVDFYGDVALTNAQKFIALQRSQTSRNLQETLGLSVYRVSSLTNVKALTGAQYKARYQVSFVAEYMSTFTEPTLRIERADLELRNEDGIFANIEITRN